MTESPESAPEGTTKAPTVPPSHRLLYLIAAVVQGLGSVLVQPFAIRMMSPFEWGQVSFALSMISIALIALTAGLPMALSTIYFEPAHGPSKARSLNAFGSIFSLVVAAVAAVIALTLFAATGTLDTNLVYLITIIIVGFHGVTQMALAYLRSSMRAGVFVVVTIVSTALGHVAGLAMITLIAPTASVYLISFAVCAGLAMTLGLLSSRPARPFAHRGALRKAVQMSLPVLPHSVALVFMLQGESVLITMFNGEALVGRYNAVMPLALGPLAVIMALSNVWQTVIFAHRGNDDDGEMRGIQSEALSIGVLLTFLGTGVAVLATYILANSPEPELFELARVLPLMAVGYVIFLLSSSQLFALQRTTALGIITPAVAVLDLLVSTLPARAGDLFLVGTIKSVSYIVLGLIYTLVVRRLAPDLVRLRPVLLAVAIGVVVTVVSLMLPTTMGWGIASALFSMAVAGVACLWYLKRRQAAVPRPADSAH